MTKKIGLLLVAVVMVFSLVVAGCAPKAEPAPGVPTVAPTAAPTPAPEQEVITWTLQAHSASASNIGYRPHLEVAAEIESITNGRFILKPYITGSICPAQQELQGCSEGTVEITSTFTPYWASLFPAFEIFSTRTGMTGRQLQFWMDTEEAQNLLNEIVSPLNVQYLTQGSKPPVGDAFVSKWKIETIEDMKGLKFRTAVTSLSQILKEMGASPTNVPFGETYDAMSRGVIDGCEMGDLVVNWDNGLQEVADYHYVSNSMLPSGIITIFVNNDAWAKLDPSFQKILKDVYVSKVNEVYIENIISLASIADNYIDYGVTVGPMPKEIQQTMNEIAAAYYITRSKELGDPLYDEVLASQERAKKLYTTIFEG